MSAVDVRIFINTASHDDETQEDARDASSLRLDDRVQMTIRLPPGLAERLDASAKREDRSRNRQAAVLLEYALRDREAEEEPAGAG